MFSDDEDCDELFADVDSDDSLVIESQSSSSSNGSDSENEKISEIAGIGANSDKERNLEPQEKVASAQRKRNLEIAEMEDDSDEERNLVPQKKRRERKKSATNKNKLSKEERSLNSHLRNSGKKYRNYKNEEVGERQRKKPHVCTRNKCHETVTDEIGEAIFHEYWEQNSYEKRVSYVASRVETYPIKVSRPRLPAGHPKAHRKSVSHKYFFDIHGERKEVCKKTFLGTLGETDGFLMITTHKKSQSISGVNKNGKRGKHVPAHKLKQTTIEEVKQHILKFPSHKSHYKRAEVGETRYLPSHLDRRQMHQMYLQEEHTPVSYSTYERIFNTMGRSFKKPYTDTCEKCDTWKEKVTHAPDVETQEKLQEEWDAHLDRAKAAYDLKKKCKIQAESDPTLRVLIFDLEQVLETPLVSTGAAFYLRQLNTYNLTIYDTTTKLTHCYMWSEVDGKRGANEIASCIFFHCLDQIDETVKKVILFSDSTVGQNKNSILSAMFLTLVQIHCSIQSVEHVFLEAGHTRLEVDSKHSVIERKKDHVDKVNVPSDWYNLVRSIGGGNNPNRRFRVVEMAGEFYDFQSFYAGPLVRRTVTTTGDKFVWLETPLLRYDANRPGKIFFKTNLEHLAYGCLSFQRSGKAGEYSAQNLRSALKVLYKSPLPITVEKKKDLLKLLPLLPPSCHDFYKSIKTTDDPSDNDLDSD
ncbi:hypothetical protein FOCC_FOCC015595 [Frankliniella occidentalis]|nr:hypothetical protein FOCC_FOCC015595 [Frankliniella occidentalis]